MSEHPTPEPTGTEPCSERIMREAAEQKLEKIREWGRTSGITIPQEESLAAILDPVQTEGEAPTSGR